MDVNAKLTTGQLSRVPPGCIAIPLSAGEMTASTRLCIIARSQAHPMQGHLVRLRQSVESDVVLGALIDAAGLVLCWLEIHTQSPDGVLSAPAVFRDSLTNGVLDDRWKRSAAWAASPQGLGITTGFESANPAPTFLDIAGARPVHPVDEQGRAWELCRDEGVLGAKGLPSYRGSLHRYLHVRGGGALIPVTSGAPANEHTRPVSELPGVAGLVAFNAPCGMLLALKRLPCSYEAVVEALGAEPAKSVLRISPLGESDARAADAQVIRPVTDGALMLSRHGRWGRIVEALHLKLRLLADAVAAVRGAVQASGTPLLNITSDSFRVDLGAPGAGLPLLWTMQAALRVPGEAVKLSVSGSETEYFMRPPKAGASVYFPDSAGRAIQGTASIRIRSVESTAKTGTGGASIVTCTFSTQERIRPSPSDLVWVRLQIGAERVDLYGRIEAAQGLAPGEWRYRTVAQQFGDSGRALKGAEGVAIADAPFQVIPLLSTPCDLYALAVLGARTLLVGNGNTLAETLDGLTSLAKHTMNESADDLGAKILGVLAADKRWIDALGPARLAESVGSPGEALDQIPLELWAEVLATLIRMVPGSCPDAACIDFGDAPEAGPGAVFDRAIADLKDLVQRTRSLIVIDWRYNREVHSVIRGIRTGLTARAAPNEARKPAPVRQ